MKAFAEFRSLLSEGHVTARATSGAKSAKKEKGATDSSDKVPFAIYMKAGWESQPARATAIITWAKRYDGRPSLRPSEMAKYWKKSGSKKPGNPGQACITAEQKGWLEKESGGSYAVVGHGEEMVDQMLAKS